MALLQSNMILGSAAVRKSPPRVLVIGGLDPSGAAGLIADVATLAQADCLSGALATTLTAQGVTHWRNQFPVDPAIFSDQCRALRDGPGWDAVKIGATGSSAITDGINELLIELRRDNPTLPVVFDPVFRSTSGGRLSEPNHVDALLGHATLITPNREEWNQLNPLRHAHHPHRLITDTEAGATLWKNNALLTQYRFERRSGNWRGTGCRLASLITAYLAHGEPIDVACAKAIQDLQQKINQAITRNQGTLLQ